MRHHQSADIFEADFGWVVQRQNVLDSPVSCIPARAEEDSMLLSIPSTSLAMK